jgi:hypothetical protein
MSSRSETIMKIKPFAVISLKESTTSQKFLWYSKEVIFVSFIIVALIFFAGDGKCETPLTTPSENSETKKEKQETKENDSGKKDTPQNNANSNSTSSQLGFYFKTVWGSWIDLVIYIYGISLLTWCIVLIWCEKWWVTPKLAKGRDKIAALCEILPLLGLAGTVLSLMGTLNSIRNTISPNDIVLNFAPALSTTLSGMVCLVVNLIFLQWLGSIIQKREQVNKK